MNGWQANCQLLDANQKTADGWRQLIDLLICCHCSHSAYFQISLLLPKPSSLNFIHTIKVNGQCAS